MSKLEKEFEELVNKVKKSSLTLGKLEDLRVVVDDLYYAHPDHPDNYNSSDDWDDSGCSF